MLGINIGIFWCILSISLQNFSDVVRNFTYQPVHSNHNLLLMKPRFREVFVAKCPPLCPIIECNDFSYRMESNYRSNVIKKLIIFVAKKKHRADFLVPKILVFVQLVWQPFIDLL
ncbi:hypothetical protein NPIL_351041 [Nephila pilipes]|uniref:Secreted protein n=1 Tax=Nephila pilipes TaxID=299642 RepID=A0A8X6U4N7_NEPPI|nr:hypothetical protein NPIL_351041 [Nephila pilipes]